MRLKPVLLLLASSLSSACAASVSSEPSPQALSYEIVNQYAHNTEAFTQGLLFNEAGQLVESSGNYGKSFIARLRAGSASEIETSTKLAKHLFAEGITIFKDQLYLLTWKAGLALVFDEKSMKPVTSHSYSGQGWGLTTDGNYLIMSNGSDELQFRSSENFAIERTVRVRLNGNRLYRLNELEWANGLVYANVWYSDTIVAINTESGAVVHTVDLRALRAAEGRQADALNGIAYNTNSGNFWVTGKHWRYLYEIKLKNAALDEPTQAATEKQPSRP